MDFSDIGAYSDDQVQPKIVELMSDDQFHQYISDLIYPRVSNLFPRLTKNFIGRKFAGLFKECNSVSEFQNIMAPLVQAMIDRTTDGFSFTGDENLSTKPTIFIGNHRDISLDAAFLNYLLYLHKFKTVRIAIGDNLLDGGFAENLMRLNKSFIVHRNIKGAKETLRKLSKLSAYIDKSIKEDRESIWIAQREGRANDGNDFTDEGVLKMLYLDQRKDRSLSDWVMDINLTPISISYEYDPLDVIKSKGWDHQEDWDLRKINQNDLKEMAQGIFGHKGRVHIHVCEPLKGQFKDTKDLANSIEKEIIRNYHIWPSSHAALSLLPEMNLGKTLFDENIEDSDEQRILEKRSEGLDNRAKKELLMTYARPLINKERAKTKLDP